jgi:putative transposase
MHRVSSEAACEALAQYAAGLWGQSYSTIAGLWERAWGPANLVFAISFAVRESIYIAKKIERLHMRRWRVINTRRRSPTDEAAFRLLLFAPQNTPAYRMRSAKR